VASDLGPGLHLHWPAPLGRGLAVDVDWVRLLTIGFRGNPADVRVSAGEEAYYLTADENLIDIRSVVSYRVSDPARFALGVENADALVAARARDLLVRIAAGQTIDAIYATGRLDVERAWREALAGEVAALGIGAELVDARLLDVHAPENVHDAFRDVASAVEDREREIHDANGYGAERRNEGVGESATRVEAARAEAARVSKQAVGDAAAFAGLAAVDAAHPAVTEQRLWLESLERTLAAPRKFIHAAGGARGDVDLWVGGPTSGALPAIALPAAPPSGPPAKEPATP
jgi:regulator of protease activity HflC (stomatin/prohibitin superfamily)